MKLVYDINDRPPLKKNLIFALQQLLAIMAATLLVPVLRKLLRKIDTSLPVDEGSQMESFHLSQED